MPDIPEHVPVIAVAPRRRTGRGAAQQRLTCYPASGANLTW
jgi:hypothetical protein